MSENLLMQAAESGMKRAQTTEQRAAELRAEAARLLERADAADQLSQRIAKGNEGEVIIGGLLDELAAEGWVVLHDRRKSPANLDHIVVGPMGVCVIDSKNWTGGRLRLSDRGMAVGKWPKNDELHSAKVDADIVGRSLAGVSPGITTCGVLAFVNDMGLEAPAFHHHVVLLQREQLLPWLRSLPAHLDAASIVRLGSHLDQVHPPRAGVRAPAQRTAPPTGTAPATAWAAAVPTDRERKQIARRRKLDREISALKKRVLVLAVGLLCLPVLPPVAHWASDMLSEHLTKSLTPTEQPAPASRTPAGR